MYTLYHDKDNSIIKITKATKAMQNLVGRDYTDEVTFYNNNYFLCLLRKPLKEKAIEMKQEWLEEAENRVQLIKNIKI